MIPVTLFNVERTAENRPAYWKWDTDYVGLFQVFIVVFRFALICPRLESWDRIPAWMDCHPEVASKVCSFRFGVPIDFGIVDSKRKKWKNYQGFFIHFFGGALRFGQIISVCKRRMVVRIWRRLDTVSDMPLYLHIGIICPQHTSLVVIQTSYVNVTWYKCRRQLLQLGRSTCCKSSRHNECCRVRLPITTRKDQMPGKIIQKSTIQVYNLEAEYKSSKKKF